MPILELVNIILNTYFIESYVYYKRVIFAKKACPFGVECSGAGLTIPGVGLQNRSLQFTMLL